MSKRQVKIYSDDEDEFIYKSFSIKTHKEMGKVLGRSTDSVKGRCRVLKLIRPYNPKRIIVAKVKTGGQQPEGRDLYELPPHLQKWFGLVPGFEPANGRVIAERMPDFTVSKTKPSIGSGSQYQIGYLASL